MQIVDIPVDQIKIPDWKFRQDTVDMEAFLENVEKVGKILVPVLVTENWDLIKGGRRLAASKVLGYPTVPGIIVESDPEFVSLSAYVHSRNLSPVVIGKIASIAAMDVMPDVYSPYLVPHHLRTDQVEFVVSHSLPPCGLR